MIRLEIVTKNDKLYFMGMDPLFLMDRLDLAGMTAIGAIEENEETGECIPAGLLIYTESKRCYRLFWLCVSPDHQMRGIGARLLATVFELSVKKGYSVVEAYFNQIPDREKYCSEEVRYFASHLFTRKEKLPGEWYSKIDAMADRLEALKLPTDKQIVPLGSLKWQERKDSTALLTRLKRFIAFQARGLQEADFDEDVSMIRYEDGNITGGLLVQAVEVTDPVFENGRLQPSGRFILYPVYVSMGNNLGTLGLIDRACRAATEKYPADTQICVISFRSMEELYNRLMPEGHVESYKLTAEVKDYLSMDEMDTDDYIL